MIEACIFDLDGVIVDTAKYHYKAWKRLAEELGFDFTEKDNERLKGVSRMTSLDILLEIGNLKEKYSEKEKEDLATKKNEWYREYITKMGKDEILPGVEGFLELLRQNGIKIAIGSASKNAKTILERIDLIDKFDSIVDGTKITKAKPDPQVFTKAADEMGEEYEDCVVFEDSQSGIDAALAAGMKAIAVGKSENLKNAHKIISCFKNKDLGLLMFH
ncbi:MAG: beta-phosphoglucomutase [Thermotogota bacterium]